MDDATRNSLLQTLKIVLGMLPRYLRHDLWRITEPQHMHAVDKIAETIAAKVDDGFEVETKPPPPVMHFAHLYRGPSEPREGS
jgi:hypothetical protein